MTRRSRGWVFAARGGWGRRQGDEEGNDLILGRSCFTGDAERVGGDRVFGSTAKNSGCFAGGL